MGPVPKYYVGWDLFILFFILFLIKGKSVYSTCWPSNYIWCAGPFLFRRGIYWALIAVVKGNEIFYRSASINNVTDPGSSPIKLPTGSMWMPQPPVVWKLPPPAVVVWKPPTLLMWKLPPCSEWCDPWAAILSESPSMKQEDTWLMPELIYNLHSAMHAYVQK